ERPSGEGDVRVRVAVSGEAYAGETRTGHHYRDPATGLGVRVGVATFIDARGARARVPVARTGDGLEARLPAALVDGAAYPAVLDPLISPEIGVDNVAYGPAVDEQHDAAVAFDGTNYFVVWTDQRAPSITLQQDIYGARVAPDGTVL